jgi:hypothetical protein
MFRAHSAFSTASPATRRTTLYACLLLSIAAEFIDWRMTAFGGKADIAGGSPADIGMKPWANGTLGGVFGFLAYYWL